jgi:hypothetical protein
MILDPTEPELPPKKKTGRLRAHHFDRPSTHPRDGKGLAIAPDRRARKKQAQEYLERTGRKLTARQRKKQRRRAAAG